jgi:tetratricopeptide (TPR) repeat protein
MWRFWQMRGHLAEGAQRVREVLDRKDLEPDCRAGALRAAGGIAYWRRDLPTCRSAYEEALAIRRRLGDEQGIADATYDLAFPMFMADDYKRAGELAAASLELYRKLGDADGTARSLWLVGMNEVFAERLAGGLVHLRGAVAMLRELADSFHLGWALRVLGRAELVLGHTDQGEAHLRESLALFQPTGDVAALVLLLADLAHLALLRGQDERALRLAGAVAGLRRLTGSHLVDIEINSVPDLGDASARLGRERAERLHAEGEAMDAAAALAYALQDA